MTDDDDHQGVIVRLPRHAVIRRRPSMFLGDLKSARQLWLVRTLLADVHLYAEHAEEREAVLTLGRDGTLRLFSPALTLTPAQLMRIMGGDLTAPSFFNGLTLANAFSSHIQVDLWRDGRHWRVHGMKGFFVTSAREVGPAEPIPTNAARGLRVECRLDSEFFERRVPTPKQLLRCIEDVTTRAPGLRVHLARPD